MNRRHLEWLGDAILCRDKGIRTACLLNPSVVFEETVRKVVLVKDLWTHLNEIGSQNILQKPRYTDDLAVIVEGEAGLQGGDLLQLTEWTDILFTD